MALKTLRFFSLLLTAMTLGAGMAHLLALPNKINLPAAAYLTVQQIYRGWALVGIVMIGALVASLTLTVMTRKRPKVFVLNLIAFLCLACSLAVFFIFTYPANQQTANWTMLPEDWIQLRRQWEYSHATGAILTLIALMSLILSNLVDDQ